MKEKRRDSKGRILHTGESQRTDGKYLYKICRRIWKHKICVCLEIDTHRPDTKGKTGKTLTS